MVRCYICNVNQARAKLQLDQNQDLNERRRELSLLFRNRFNLNNLEINPNSRLCLNCNQRLVNTIENDNNPLAVAMEVIVGKRRCFICDDFDNANRLSILARVDFYIKTNIYIPLGTRCCPHHLTQSGLIQLRHMENHISLPLKIIMSGEELNAWFSTFVKLINTNTASMYENEDNFEENDFQNLTSISKVQFQELFNICQPVVVYNQTRHLTKKYLLAFLIKLRHGVSDSFLKSIMHFSSVQNVSLAISISRITLLQNFVPNCLGFDCPEVRNRENFIQNHVTSFSNILYNPTPERPCAILYPDCTYIKAFKSSHFRAQRQSYSSHKHYTLFKAGLIVAPDGYIVDVHGPYFSDARNNDAAILLSEMEHDRNNIHQWVQNNDVFVVDRGYRDAVEFLENLQLNVEIPSMLPRNQRQLTTEQANHSRKITKTRWIVESRNGHLKSIFKFFNGVIQIQHAVNLADFLKIACAFINRYKEPIHMQDAEDQLAEQMLAICRNPNNNLQAIVDQNNLVHRRGGAWENLENNNIEFPNLPFEYMRSKTFGTYQVKLAPAYIQDTANRQENDFIFQVQLLEPGLLRAKIFSRFTQAIRHTIFVSFLLPPLEAGQDPITGTYCTCKVGARTLGLCAHLASVIWYLGYARHQEEQIKYPSNILLRSILDAAGRDIGQQNV